MNRFLSKLFLFIRFAVVEVIIYFIVRIIVFYYLGSVSTLSKVCDELDCYVFGFPL